jgi:hypothetical protein
MYTGTGLSIVTDENGHTIVATGPVTFEYLTTLPNGIVSTVTEVVTPSADVHSNPSNPHASAYVFLCLLQHCTNLPPVLRSLP